MRLDYRFNFDNWVDVFSSLNQVFSGLFFEGVASLRVAKNSVDTYVESIPTALVFILRIFVRIFKYNHLSDIVVYDNPEYILRFVFNYVVNCVESTNRLIIRTSYAAVQSVFSVIGFYSNANWFEREIMEMFNLIVGGHPNSSKLLGDYTSESGYLRKGESDSNTAKDEQSDVIVSKVFLLVAAPAAVPPSGDASEGPNFFIQMLSDFYESLECILPVNTLLHMPHTKEEFAKILVICFVLASLGVAFRNKFMLNYTKQNPAKTALGNTVNVVIFYTFFFFNIYIWYSALVLPHLFLATDLIVHDIQRFGDAITVPYELSEKHMLSWSQYDALSQNLVHFNRAVIAYANTSVKLVFLDNLVNSGMVFVDGISLWLIWLTVVVSFVLCVLAREDQTPERARIQKLLIAATAILAIACFFTADLLVFFMCFEATLVPLYFLVGVFGSRSEKSRAATMLFIYTLVGSSFLWIVVVYCYGVLGTTNFDMLSKLLMTTPSGVNAVLFWCLFLGFAFKVPVLLLHVWLTVAHVEAPTIGSVLLAGLILKLGGYGLLRWVVLLLPVETMNFGLIVAWVCLVGYVVATFFAVQQTDLKRFIAYTSISHMNFGTAVLFNHTDIGLTSYIHTLISHGVIASGLFILVGFVYYQTGSRDSMSLNALATSTPQYSVFWFLFIIANAGIPMFSAFPGEFFGLLSLVQSNGFSFLGLIFVGFFVTAVYSFVNLTRVLYGAAGEQKLSYLRDTTEVVTAVMYALIGWSILLGMCPDVVFRSVQYTAVYNQRTELLEAATKALADAQKQAVMCKNPRLHGDTNPTSYVQYYINNHSFWNYSEEAVEQRNRQSVSLVRRFAELEHHRYFLALLNKSDTDVVVKNILKAVKESEKSMFPDVRNDLLHFVDQIQKQRKWGLERFGSSHRSHLQNRARFVLEDKVRDRADEWSCINAVWGANGIYESGALLWPTQSVVDVRGEWEYRDWSSKRQPGYIPSIYKHTPDERFVFLRPMTEEDVAAYWAFAYVEGESETDDLRKLRMRYFLGWKYEAHLERPERLRWWEFNYHPLYRFTFPIKPLQPGESYTVSRQMIIDMLYYEQMRRDMCLVSWQLQNFETNSKRFNGLARRASEVKNWDKSLNRSGDKRLCIEDDGFFRNRVIKRKE